MRLIIVIACIILAGFVYDAGAQTSHPLIVTWDYPTTNVDGTPLTDLSHFELYMSDSPVPEDGSGYLAMWTVPAGPTVYEFDAEVQGPISTLHFRLRACDTANNCGPMSNHAQYVLPDSVPPGQAVNLNVRSRP